MQFFLDLRYSFYFSNDVSEKCIEHFLIGKVILHGGKGVNEVLSLVNNFTLYLVFINFPKTVFVKRRILQSVILSNLHMTAIQRSACLSLLGS